MIKSIAIQRLLMNLIDNAWQYGKQDVEVSTQNQGDSILIAIKDRGDGVPEDEVEILKKPFTRMETSRSDTKGAGLGLAIVDRIVQWHHGRFDLRRRQGGGLIVEVSLPVTL